MVEKRNDSLKNGAFSGCGTNKELMEQLFLWLKDVNAENFDLVGAVTRRAFNIIWLLMQKSPELGNMNKYFTSDNGLLNEAEGIAQHYIQHGHFPRVAVLDDILIHGRSLNQFLKDFQSKVFDCLELPDTVKNQTAIVEDFYQSITLWVFAINKAPFSLKQEYQWRLRYQFICPEEQWRKHSVGIAQTLREADIANTSYVISASLKATLSSGDIAADSDWICCKQSKAGQTFYCLPDICKYGVYPTVRSYKMAGKQFFTPYLFTGNVNPDQMVQILQNLFDQIPQKKPSYNLIGLFNHIAKHRTLHVYCQLFYLILSQVTLHVFLSENFQMVKVADYSYDYQKIAHNFGIFSGVEECLKDLVKTPWTRKQLYMALQPLMEKASSENGTCFFSILPDLEKETLQTNIEYAIYEQALAHEVSYAMIQKNAAPVVKTTGETPLTRFLKELDVFDGSKKVWALSCLTVLMDEGYVSLKAKLDRTQGKKPVFCSVVRNTELSLAILPRRIQERYNDFTRLAQFYWRDNDFPQRVRNYFENKYNLHSHDHFVKDAVKFAELICCYREIVDTMINWGNVYGSTSNDGGS